MGTEPMSEPDGDSTKTLHIGLPTDASGYLRHECPSCGLEFKVKGDESRFTDALGWWVSKALSENGVADPATPHSAPVSKMTCPYCQNCSEAQDFLHAEYRAYVRRITLREIAEPMIFAALADMERAFSGSSRGLISIKMEAGSRHRSPRPMAGPDPDDLARVRCERCRERFKVMIGWPGGVYCPACGSVLRLG